MSATCCPSAPRRFGRRGDPSLLSSTSCGSQVEIEAEAGHPRAGLQLVRCLAAARAMLLGRCNRQPAFGLCVGQKVLTAIFTGDRLLYGSPSPPEVIVYSLAPPRYSELPSHQCDAWLSATSRSLDEVACSTVMASWRPSRASSRVASATSRSRRSLSPRPISTDSSTLSV